MDDKMPRRLYEPEDASMNIGAEIFIRNASAEKWGIFAQRIRILCNGNRIPGAIKTGNQRAIPDSGSMPADARISGKSIKTGWDNADNRQYQYHCQK